MKSMVKAALVGFAISAVSVAYAADEWPSFRKADNDNNGAISMDEARNVEGLGADFAQFDKDNDGQLSRSEYESAKKDAGASKSSDKGAEKK